MLQSINFSVPVRTPALAVSPALHDIFLKNFRPPLAVRPFLYLSAQRRIRVFLFFYGPPGIAPFFPVSRSNGVQR
jgi:hypothetical protein